MHETLMAQAAPNVTTSRLSAFNSQQQTTGAMQDY
jgi:hypothetical protein